MYTAIEPEKHLIVRPRPEFTQDGHTPFVHPTATTSLLAQSNAQHAVSSSSMRSSGSVNLTAKRVREARGLRWARWRTEQRLDGGTFDSVGDSRWIGDGVERQRAVFERPADDTQLLRGPLPAGSILRVQTLILASHWPSGDGRKRLGRASAYASFDGNGHHLSSNAGPLSMQSTISHRISPAPAPLPSCSLPAAEPSWASPSTFMRSAGRSDGFRLQIWMHAGLGRRTRVPIMGEWDLDGNGATARYWVNRWSIAASKGDVVR